jgi:hypothetical protein
MLPSRGLDLGRVLLVEVAQGDDLGVAEQRVAVEVELGVQRHDVALAVAVERIDLDQRGIRLHVAGVELLQDVDRLRGGVGRHADAVGDLLGLRVGQAVLGVGVDGDDLLGRGVGHFLDVHAAFARRDERDLLRRAVGHGRNVVFLVDVGTVLDVEATDLLAFGAGLVRLELHAQDLAGDALDVLDGLGDLDAAALAAAARVDLGLDDPDRAAELLGGLDRLLDRVGRNAARHGHAELGKNFLALVLVDLHEVSLGTEG